MGRKKIKYLGKRRKLRCRINLHLKEVLILLGVIVSVIVVFFITKHIEDLYKKKNIESSKIEYYMDVADEVGEFKTQVNWKEILSIEMVVYKNDLSQIRKKDSLDIAKKFISKKKDKDSKYIYKVKTFEVVLDELKFNKDEKRKANKYNKELEDLFLGDKDLDENSKQIIFIEKIENMAIENYKKYKILPSITIAQCILESGWGESQLSKSSNNLFGIKADSRWNGKSIEVATSENYNDKIRASFRVYNSIDGSVEDHGKFLSENKRYTDYGLFEASHYKTQAQALEDAGYSTKKNEKGEAIYADMLINLIRNYNLQLIDSKVQLDN